MNDTQGRGIRRRRDPVRSSDSVMLLEHLQRLSAVVGSSLDAATIARDAIEPLLALTRSSKAAISVTPSSGEEALNASNGFEPGFALEPTPAALAILGETPILAFQRGSELPSAFGEAPRALDGPVAVAALAAHGRTRGAILLSRDQGEAPFEESTQKALGTAACQLVLAIENAVLVADLQASYQRLVDGQEVLIRNESLAALGGLAATMAHEIRNPLATIFSSLSQIQKHAQLSGEAATLLEIAEEEALRLNRMVGRLLEFARPRTPRPDDVKLMQAIRDALAKLTAQTPIPQGIEIAVEESLGPRKRTARLDPELFQSAMLHILSNALAAVKAPGGRICVRAVSDRDTPRVVTIEVEDNGCGIPAEVSDRIFEPFFSTKPSGVGLGLSVVKRIVEDHGGRIEVRSEPGKGTVFRMSFPDRA